MTEFTLGYREVISDQDLFEKWNDITLTTGGTQSTLQDIKATEKAGGYSYANSTKYYTRNRFIYWRINSDLLELIEHSLDINLTSNKLRYRFVDSPIIDGISVQETDCNIFILVPTVCSVHRLVFPHPSQFHLQDELLDTNPNLAAPSIFSKATAADARNPNNFYVFNNPSTVLDQLPNLASSHYSLDMEEAIFLLSYPSNELLLVKLNLQGQTICMELKTDSLMPRFISGLTEKFRSKNNDGNQIMSTLIDVIEFEVFALTLMRNGCLKLWSCKTGQCVAAIDLLSEMGDCATDRLQNALLRKSVGSKNDGRLAIFMSYPSGSQFHVVKPIVKSQIQIKRLVKLSSIENDLIDFSIQFNCIWAVWRTSEDGCAIFTGSLQTQMWTPVVKELIYETQVPQNPGDCDPRQVYLQHLFHPGRFPLHIINKSLGIYRKSNLKVPEINLTSVAALKQAICLAIEMDIQRWLSGRKEMDDEYLEYAEWCWQKFYSCCIQYHQASLRPLGLMLLPQSSGAILLKRATFSFLRPMEALEHMALSSDYLAKNQLLNFAILEDDKNLLDDVIVLFKAIVFIENQLSNSFKATFEKEIGISLKPDVVIDELLNSLKFDMEPEYDLMCKELSIRLNQSSDLYKAIHKVLELLRHDSSPAHPDNEINPNALHYFSSSLGVSFVASCLRQQCQNRFSICRNLLIICEMLVECESIQPNVLEAIHSVCKPEIIYLTQADFVMLWLTRLPALNNVPHESTLKRLTPIKLTPANNVRPHGTVFSLLELFTSSTGGQEARKKFAKIDYNGEIMAHWHMSLLPFISNLRHTLWPLRSNTILQEWLVSSGQHVWLQQYVRLLNPWCEWNISSCNFLVAVSFLTSAENYKALDLFQAAAKGILNEPFLQKLIKGQRDHQGYVIYYLKVIQLFELHKARDCVIQIANRALSIVDPDSPLMATLYSIKFKHHLALKRYKEAFYALKANPDLERKKDNLRDLVKSLLDERQFDLLLSFSYGDMEELFTNILLTRARATDATNNVFYDFLYAHLIKRGALCHRLASSVMYEQAFRLSQCDSIEALEKQVKCCLAAKNILQLIDPQYAWVIRPSDPDEDDTEVTLESLAGSQKDSEVFRLKKQVVVVNIETIKKELIFCSAKLKLARFDPTTFSNSTDPVELITLMSSAGLYKTSLEVCTTFNIPHTSVFESLTWRCVMLSEEETSDAWNWLIENDLQDLSANRESASLVAWELLKNLLEKYEEPNSTTLHKAICKKIVSLRMYVPFWLLASYKVRNPSQLLKILHGAGRLEEAFEMCHEYLLAALGYGKELYGFKVSLAPNSVPVYLPVYEIQALITELKMQNERDFEKPFEKEHKLLDELFSKYMTTATRISNEKCQHEMPPFGSIGTNSMVF